MTGALDTASPSDRIFRLARAPDPWAWPDWSNASRDGTFGNRWDDPAGAYRVLYASSTRFGALIETLARFRPDLEVVAGIREIDGPDDAVPAGTVPPEWFERRLMGVANLTGAYADIGTAASLTLLRSRLAATAVEHGVTDIDGAAIRLAAPRAFTQAISRFVYESHTPRGDPFAGIQYRSRLDDGTLNWAIFEPTPGSPTALRPIAVETVRPDDPDVAAALATLGLTIK